jgi:DNA modification methylase
MLFKRFDEISGKVLKHNKTLLFSAAQGYVRPKETGSFWWLTTTSIWPVDELIGRRIRDWRRWMNETGHSGSRNETMRADHDSIYTGSHSVFPAPLCEWIILRYGGSSGGLILDAFAGGPPRAVVAALMGYKYLGYDIRQEQIDENLRVVNTLGIAGSINYQCSDGTILSGCADNSCDFAISCPPYYDLEQYSDLPNDLSNMPDYKTFDESMLRCAQAHFRVMKPGAFVCIVTCPFRVGGNKDENELRDFPGDTISNFREAGFMLWQKIVLSRNFASAACRSTTSWKGKKLVPRHEELLVFRKPEEAKRKRLKLD